MALSAFQSSMSFANEHLKGARRFNSRDHLIEYCIEQTKNEFRVEGLYAEFGVYKGDSLKIICDAVGSNVAVFGFDSFEGLPQDWGTVLSKGAFALDRLPKVPNNAVLIKGWFKDTLLKFIKEYHKPFAFIHIDCDLYQSTKDVLDILAPQIMPGTIILFDEYINIVDWENHEFRAFQEFVSQNNMVFEYIAYHSEQTLGAGTEVAVRILGA